jgi:hypothetical protein
MLEPITKLPAGSVTISGQSAQSLIADGNCAKTEDAKAKVLSMKANLIEFMVVLIKT